MQEREKQRDDNGSAAQPTDTGSDKKPERANRPDNLNQPKKQPHEQPKDCTFPPRVRCFTHLSLIARDDTRAGNGYNRFRRPNAPSLEGLGRCRLTNGPP